MNEAELHGRLHTLLLQVERDKEIQPVVKFVGALTSGAKARRDIIEWIQKVSPLVFRERADGKLSARLSKSGKFSLGATQSTPSRRTEATKRVAVSNTATLSSRPKLKKEGEKRLQLHSQEEILKAVREFLTSPNEHQFAKLIEQLEQYKKYGVTMAGVDRESRIRLPYISVVQGGLPSLGKRAK